MKIITILLISLSFYCQNSSAGSLWWTEQLISLRFDVSDISHQQLKKLLAEDQQQKLILFDIRRPEEFITSHISGSIQVNPDMKAQDFMHRYGTTINNKNLIFYCSVGYRSSEFIQRLKESHYLNNSQQMSNLTGGIFRWYNEGHSVVDSKGETNNMHPSDDSWADLIEQRPK